MDNPIFRERYYFLIGRWMPFVLVIFLSVIGADSVFASPDSHGTKGWVATDSYRVLNFLVLAVAIYFVLRKPITKSLGERVEKIRSNLDDLVTRKETAQAELAKYDSKLAGLNEETERILGEYVEQGNKAKDRILAEAESTAEKMKQRMENDIEYEFEQARARLRYEVVDKALIKAETIIKKEIVDDDQEKLVDEYLKEVVA